MNNEACFDKKKFAITFTHNWDRPTGATCYLNECRNVKQGDRVKKNGKSYVNDATHDCNQEERIVSCVGRRATLN